MAEKLQMLYILNFTSGARFDVYTLLNNGELILDKAISEAMVNLYISLMGNAPVNVTAQGGEGGNPGDF